MEPVNTRPLRSTHWLGLLVGLLWLVHGLEKVTWLIAPGFAFPAPLWGGTGDVLNNLIIFARDNPQPWFRALVGRTLLPLGALNQYGVMGLELALGLVFLAGPRRWLRDPSVLYAAGLLGISQLAFIWMGFYWFEWPFTYLLIMAAHLVVVLNVRSTLQGPAPAGATDWGLVIGWLLGVMWLAEGARLGSPLRMITGGMLLLGVLTPLAALAGMGFAVLSFAQRAWGGWWWVYYFAAAEHLYVWIRQGGRKWRWHPPW